MGAPTPLGVGIPRCVGAGALLSVGVGVGTGMPLGDSAGTMLGIGVGMQLGVGIRGYVVGAGVPLGDRGEPRVLSGSSCAHRIQSAPDVLVLESQNCCDGRPSTTFRCMRPPVAISCSGLSILSAKIDRRTVLVVQWAN